jgi:magnesium-transporting ATPase (P-type)
MVRSDDKHLFSQGWKGLTGTRMLFVATVASMLLQLMVVYWAPLEDIFKVSPLTLGQLLLCVVSAMSAFLLVPRILIKQVNSKN